MKAAKKKRTPLEIVADYSYKYYSEGLYCTLCANSGTVDTTQTAITPFGERVGRKQFCICPNGQALRRLEMYRNTYNKNHPGKPIV